MSMTALDQLKAWMDRSKLNQAEAAEVIGLNYYTLNKILTGARVPGRENAVKIQDKTGIPVGAWASIGLDETEHATGTHGRK